MKIKSNEYVCLMTYLAAKPYVKEFRTAIDIGCRDGDFSRPMSEDFTKVEAFDYRKRTGFDTMHNVTHREIALGDVEKQVKAYSGVITDKPRKEGTERIVQQKTLDSFDFKMVDLIKIDVEGHEFRVLKGGENTIKKYSPIIIIEDNGSDEKWGKETGAIDLLKEMGYEIKAEYKNDLILVRKI